MENEKQEKAAISLASKLTFSRDNLIINILKEVAEGRQLKHPNVSMFFLEAEILQWWGRIDLLARVIYISDPINLFDNCCDHFFVKKKVHFENEEEKNTLNKEKVDQYIKDWNKVDERLKILIFLKKDSKEPYNLKESIEDEEYNLTLI